MNDDQTTVVLKRIGAVALTALLFGAIAADPASAQVPTTNPPDTAIVSSAVTEDFPAVRINPTNADKLATTFSRGDGCFVRSSSNGGATWSTLIRLRASLPGASCVNADIAFAPDGSRLYAAYAEWAPATNDWAVNRISTAFSLDGGLTWSVPKVALQGSADPYGEAYRDPSLATSMDATYARWVYLTAVKYHSAGAETQFVRSGNYGNMWTTTTSLLIRRHYSGYSMPPLRSTRQVVAGGPRGEVLLVSACGGCETEEYSEINSDQGIRVWRSMNFGATFSGTTTPIYARRGGLEYAFPENVDGGWGGATAVGPAISYGTGSTAHIVYPTAPQLNYIWARPPFTSWSAPETVDDTSAGMKRTPALQAQSCGSTVYLHAIWYDTRNDSTGNNYDIYYAQRAAAAAGIWSNNVRVTNASSYPRLPWSSAALAVNGASAFAVWPDRRDNGGQDRDIFGSSILSGLTCP